jgi:hypothetical protein
VLDTGRLQLWIDIGIGTGDGARIADDLLVNRRPLHLGEPPVDRLACELGAGR